MYQLGRYSRCEECLISYDDVVLYQDRDEARGRSQPAGALILLVIGLVKLVVNNCVLGEGSGDSAKAFWYGKDIKIWPSCRHLRVRKSGWNRRRSVDKILNDERCDVSLASMAP